MQFSRVVVPFKLCVCLQRKLHSSPQSLCQACLPHERLFQGETDGSSFPNGGLRVTHSAAAFTTWDRASPPFVMDKCGALGRDWQLVVGRYVALIMTNVVEHEEIGKCLCV